MSPLDDRKQQEPREVIGYAMPTLFVFNPSVPWSVRLNTE